MSGDDQHFLDILSSIPHDVRRYSGEVADSIDRHFNSAAEKFRDTLTTSTWVPDVAKPAIRRHTVYSRTPAPVPQSLYQRAADWAIRHKEVLIIAASSASLAGYLAYRHRRKHLKKRRAKRAGNGARKEVFVIAGSPHEPLVKSLANDFERRGFIVFVIVNSVEDEQLVTNESRGDIKPLFYDITNPSASQAAILHFNQLLSTPQYAFQGANPHTLKLAGFVVIPHQTFQAGPIEALGPETWSDELNTQLLAPVTTIQSFVRTICDFQSRIVVCTPNITSSIRPPFHAPESAVMAALEAFTVSLQRELSTINIDVCHFKLGAFDFRHQIHNASSAAQIQPNNPTRADILSWPASLRSIYAQNYLATTTSKTPTRTSRGAPLRDFHNAVFDASSAPNRPARTWHVGSGSLSSAFVRSFVPWPIAAWFLGLRHVDPAVVHAASASLGDSNPTITASLELDKSWRLGGSSGHSTSSGSGSSPDGDQARTSPRTATGWEKVDTEEHQ